MSTLGDLGSLQGILQGLITLSIGAIVSIKVFRLNIRVGHAVTIDGNDNVVNFLSQNFYSDDNYKLSYKFRALLFVLIMLCFLFTSLPKFLVIEAVALCIPLTIISFLGAFASDNRLASVCYFISTLFISWFIWRNYTLMDFVVKWTPAIYPTWAEFKNAGFGQNTVNYIGYFISVLTAVGGISLLVLLQIQTAFSFLINRGRLDDALRFSVTNAGLSFLMILLSGGVLATLSAPQLVWPNIQNGNPGYYILWFVRMALYNTFWIEALKP